MRKCEMRYLEVLDKDFNICNLCDGSIVKKFWLRRIKILKKPSQYDMFYFHNSSLIERFLDKKKLKIKKQSQLNMLNDMVKELILQAQEINLQLNPICEIIWK